MYMGPMLAASSWRAPVNSTRPIQAIYAFAQLGGHSEHFDFSWAPKNFRAVVGGAGMSCLNYFLNNDCQEVKIYTLVKV